MYGGKYKLVVISLISRLLVVVCSGLVNYCILWCRCCMPWPLYIHIYMQKHIQHNKDERYSSLEKYTSHFIERVVCERELETEQRLQHIDPHSYGHNSVSFCSPGLLNRGPGGSASLGHGPHSSTFSPTATAQSGFLRAPSAGCWFSLRHLISNWVELPVHRVI